MSIRLKKTEAINTQIAIPGSKSYTNRALIAAVLSRGTTVLRHISPSDDTATLISALRKIGASIEAKNDYLLVHGWGENLPSINTTINIGPAGTPARFLTGLASILPHSEVVIEGNEHMNTRPIGPLVEAIRKLGVNVAYLKKTGCTPIRIVTSDTPQGGVVELDGSVSSQYFSALMLIAPALARGLHITPIGTLTSTSYVEMTCETVSAFGARVSQHKNTYIVHGPYGRDVEYEIEADASGAMNILGLAAVCGGQAVITNLPATTKQGDIRLVDIFEGMGCTKIINQHGVGIKAGQLTGTRSDMNLLPDSAMVAGVVAAFADSPTTLTGLSTLKHKETDRLKALSQELAKLGAHSDFDDDSITVQPIEQLPRHIPVINTYDDHRIAMAFAVAAGKTDVVIENPEVVSKSFPSFWDVLSRCGVTIEEMP